MDGSDPETMPPAPGTDRPSADVDSRVRGILRTADLHPVAQTLSDHRVEVLDRWLRVAERQPFHHERPEGAVSDHIPRLLDAVIGALGRSDIVDQVPTAPLDDDDVLAAAIDHAQVRFDQGLGPVAVVTEFRILRQEIARAIYSEIAPDATASDVVAGITLIGDALDGAATVALTALSNHIETLRESFLATTLHDVRQPITLVEGSLHLADRWLTEGTADQTRVAEVVRDALLATSELVMMIDTLSDASRVAMGALRAELEPASLEHVVRDAIGALGRDGRRRVTLDVQSKGHLIGLWDPSLLRRLVTNLVGNALKYSPPDTIVAVTLDRSARTIARMTVQDQGMGMSSDELSRVFERFIRAERARERGTPGLGLGLYACRGIVTAHDGTIDVRSEGPDRGTVVVVTLPMIADDEVAEVDG